MEPLAQTLMEHVRQHPTVWHGQWVGTPSDFAALAEPGAVTNALDPLVRSGELRHVGRALYHHQADHPDIDTPPRASPYLTRRAIERRDSIRTFNNGASCANQLQLTTQSPVRLRYLTDGPSFEETVDGFHLEFEHIPSDLVPWLDRPALQAVTALLWLGPDAATDVTQEPDYDPDLWEDENVHVVLASELEPAVIDNLVQHAHELPEWARTVASNLSDHVART